MGLLQPVLELEDEQQYFIYNLQVFNDAGTNSMELTPSETASRSARQEILNILWNPMVDYHIQNSLSLILILEQINPVHTTLL
jgi:hypothetical protein